MLLVSLLCFIHFIQRTNHYVLILLLFFFLDVFISPFTSMSSSLSVDVSIFLL